MPATLEAYTERGLFIFKDGKYQKYEGTLYKGYKTRSSCTVNGNTYYSGITVNTKVQTSDSESLTVLARKKS